MKPPKVSIRWCPKCGRTDRYGSLGTQKHWHQGFLCKGEPVLVIYTNGKVAE